MKHAATRALYAYWDRCRGERAAPDRADIEPGAIRHVLGDTFIVTFDPKAGHPFRLAGTRICALFGGELKDSSFADLWTDETRSEMLHLIATVANDMTGVVTSATSATADGQSLDLELLMLPLRGQRMATRLLGSLSPMRPPYWAGFKPLQQLSLNHYRHLVPDAAPPRLRVPSATPLRERLRLVVHQGGRAE